MVFKYFFYQYFAILIFVCLGVVLLGFILFGAVGESWICMSIFFPRLGKFLAVISSTKFSASFCLFSFWHPYYVNVIMLDNKISSVTSTVLFFSFCSSVWSLSSLQISDHWSILQHLVIGCWFLLMYFSFQLFFSSNSFSYF